MATEQDGHARGYAFVEYEEPVSIRNLVVPHPLILNPPYSKTLGERLTQTITS
jgi:hypothetical protein